MPRRRAPLRTGLAGGARAAALLAALAAAGPASGQEPAASPERAVPLTLRGRAIDEAGEPIAGACLLLARRRELSTERALREPTARAGTDGRFEVSWTVPKDLVTGWSDVRHPLITAPGRGAALWSGLLVWAGAGAQTHDLGDVVLPKAGVIAGSVRSEDGRPIEGARVVATDVLLRATLLAGGSVSVGFVSCGRTDANGTFVLPGVLPPGAELTVKADGHRAVRLPFVTPRDPLAIEMPKGGFVEGVVQDRGGKPVRAQVGIGYEVADPSDTLAEPTVTAPDGTFRLNLDLPHRYRVVAWDRGGFVSARSEVLAGPRTGVVLRPPALAPDAPAVAVRVTDAATGKAIERARATAHWRESPLAGSSGSRWHSAVEPGAIRLPGPRQGEPSTGSIVVVAEGYAPAWLKDVVWDEAEPPRLEAKLVPESVLSGVVVDEITGKPVAGARLLVGEEADGPTLPWLQAGVEAEGRVTDGDGRFRVTGLGAGEHVLRARLPFRPDSGPLAVTAGAGEERAGLELAIPAGAELSGKLIGALPPGGGATVRLSKSDRLFFWMGSDDPSGWTTRTAGVAADGTFGLRGLEKGTYTLELVPAHRGRGSPLVLPIGTVPIGSSGLQRDFDVTDARPGAIEGRLTASGARLPPERLAVRAARQREPGPAWRSIGRHTAYTFVGPDGTFHLDVAPGEHQLQVVDLATWIVLLAVPEPVTVAASEVVTSDLAIELAEVHVTLVPADEHGDVVASRLEVDVQHEAGHPAAAIAAYAMDSGAGVSLADGKREVTLFLPAVATVLRVHSSTAELLQDENAEWAPPEPLAEHEFTPRLGEIHRVEIVVER